MIKFSLLIIKSDELKYQQHLYLKHCFITIINAFFLDF